MLACTPLSVPAAAAQQRCRAAAAPAACTRSRHALWQPARPPRRLTVAAGAAAGGKAKPTPAVTLTMPNGDQVMMHDTGRVADLEMEAINSTEMTIGSGPLVDIRMDGANIAPRHARIELKGGRLFCTALGADTDGLLAPTHCWMDGVELRPMVNYLVAPGTRICVGSQENCIECAFQEGGSSAIAEMLLQGLAAGASKEVREKLQGGA